MRSRMEALQSKFPEVADVRGRGAMQACELVQRDSIEPNAELAKAVAKHCADNAVLVLVTGTFGNVLRFLPPLTMSDELLNEAFDVLEEAFEKALS